MAQFDVHPTRYSGAPLVVDLQNDLLSHLDTRVVIPLVPSSPSHHIKRLHPFIAIDGVVYDLMTAQLSSVLVADLQPPIMSLASMHRQTIMDAVDFLMSGF